MGVNPFTLIVPKFLAANDKFPPSVGGKGQMYQMTWMYKLKEIGGRLVIFDMDGNCIGFRDAESVLSNLMCGYGSTSQYCMGAVETLYDATRTAVQQVFATTPLVVPTHETHPYLHQFQGHYRKRTSPRYSGVYFVQFDRIPNLMKVGSSQDIYNRIKEHASRHVSTSCVTHGLIITDDLARMETLIHDALRADLSVSNRASEFFPFEGTLQWIKEYAQ
jgi:hypothetical protein